MMQPMASWMWLAGGLALLAVELVTPSGFFVMFFGIGALLTGLAAAVGAVTAPVPQWTLFTVTSVLSLLLFRGKIQARVEHSGPRKPVDSLVGEIAFPVETMASGDVGRVTLRGTTWDARNEGDTTLGANQRCRVTRVSGLQLGVVAE
jgi:inner membrane protein